MAVNNYGAIHMPEIVQYANSSARSTVTYVGLDSSAHYLGSFVPFATGSAAAPSGIEFGVPAYSDDSWIGGIVVNFIGPNGERLVDDSNRKGTVTDATGELPMKYTFSATNDESNTTSMDGELLEILPICSGDVLEVSLWGASTVSVDRGTTTAYGTTGSSANFGVSLAVDTTYSFALLESSAAKAIANNDFVTVAMRGSKPQKQHRVYVKCVRCFDKLYAPN